MVDNNHHRTNHGDDLDNDDNNRKVTDSDDDDDVFNDYDKDDGDYDRAEQLPNVEDMKITSTTGGRTVIITSDEQQQPTSSSTTTTINNTKKKKTKILLLFLLLVMIPIIIIIVIKTISSSSSKTVSGNNFQQTTNEYNEWVQTLSEYILENEWTIGEIDQENVIIPGTPQYLAIQWIAAKNNPQQLDTDFDSFSIQLAEQYAIMVFYYTLNGTNWNYDSHFGSMEIDICQWNTIFSIKTIHIPVKVGITCSQAVTNEDVITDRITDLFLPSNRMIGTIPKEIKLLAHLRAIDLYNNSIYGTIPTELSTISTLQSIELHSNLFTGSIPNWLYQLSNLQTFNVAHNLLSGTFPSELVHCTSMQIFNVQYNDLSGDLNNLYGWTNIQELILDYNPFLQGEITDNLIYLLPSLEIFDISNCAITGTIPRELFQHTNLRIIDLHNNSFTGPLPTMSSLSSTNSQIEFLALHNNQLRGPIDKNSIIQLKQLQHLDLSNNQFTGIIPSSIFIELTNLKYFFIAFNNFLTPGNIPTEIGLLSNTLQDLSLQQTNRIGTIPTELGNLHELVLLDLASNALNGPLPTQFGTGLSKLKFMMIHINGITGTIPTEYSNLKHLDTIIIVGTSLNGGTKNICNRVVSPPPTTTSILQEFVADCTRIACDCCTDCCNNGPNRNECLHHDAIYFAQYDPIYAYEYQRQDYIFHDEDVIITPSNPNSTINQEYYNCLGRTIP